MKRDLNNINVCVTCLWGFTGGSVVMNLPANEGHGREDSLEKEMGTYSSILVWEIPWTEEPGGLLVHGVANSRTRLRD